MTTQSFLPPLPKPLLVFGLLCLAFVARWSAAERGSHIILETPIPEPEWRLPLITNGSGSISNTSHLGKVTYLDFWASWCGPCRLSLPALNRIDKEFDATDFQIIAISVDYVDQDALDFLDRYPVDYPIAIDKTGDLGRNFGVAGMPSGYLIDRSGHIREIHIGFRKGDEVILKESISALIAES
jgi:cytochrome c biogenesis protein CcmG/thiol:disulfide interchange protein DsbE